MDRKKLFTNEVRNHIKHWNIDFTLALFTYANPNKMRTIADVRLTHNDASFDDPCNAIWSKYTYEEGMIIRLKEINMYKIEKNVVGGKLL